MNLRKFIKNCATFWKIIEFYKYSALLLLIIILLSALGEMLGLGMVLPLLEVITGSENLTGGSARYLAPVLKYFSNEYHLLVICLIFVSLIIVKNLLFIIRIAYSARFSYRFKRLWASGIMKKYMCSEYPFILSNKHGVLLNNLIREPGRAAKALQLTIELFSRTILILFLYGLLLFTSWQVTLVLTTVAFVLLVLTWKTINVYSLGVGRKRLEYSQKLMTQGAEKISGSREVKLFSLEKMVYEHFDRDVNILNRLLIKYRIIRFLPRTVIETLAVTGIVMALLYIAYVSKLELMGMIPVIGLFVVISQRLIPIISQIMEERMHILTYIPSLKLVHDLYSVSIRQENLDQGTVIDVLKEDIFLKNVTFSYDTKKPLFKDLSITIAKGKMTAIVGASGSGKSTVVDLLTGFFKAKEGEILINGDLLQKINLRSWREKIGFVSQDTFLFHATVKENILMGKPDALDKDIFEAARKAHADEFIQEMPDGYGTVIGDRGVRLSGGQRQRLAIARAIIRDPELLIFDEATSSLDTESERLIQDSIENLAEQKTIIIISHRLSTVKRADKIYVLDNGAIVESGTFEELEKNKGRFHKMSII